MANFQILCIIYFMRFPRCHIIITVFLWDYPTELLENTFFFFFSPATIPQCMNQNFCFHPIFYLCLLCLFSGTKVNTSLVAFFINLVILSIFKFWCFQNKIDWQGCKKVLCRWQLQLFEMPYENETIHNLLKSYWS